jgi:predicted GIY-YIG superfamily endonuclease
MTAYYCYIVYNERDRTYNGYTVNLRRRLRQHNGELVGGARATRGRGPWRFAAVLTCDAWDCVSVAMRHEWSIKYPTRRRPRPKEFEGVEGRLRGLGRVFAGMDADADVRLHVPSEFASLVAEIVTPYPFVSIHPLDMLEI